MHWARCPLPLRWLLFCFGYARGLRAVCRSALANHAAVDAGAAARCGRWRDATRWHLLRARSAMNFVRPRRQADSRRVRQVAALNLHLRGDVHHARQRHA